MYIKFGVPWMDDLAKKSSEDVIKFFPVKEGETVIGTAPDYILLLIKIQDVLLKDYNSIMASYRMAVKYKNPEKGTIKKILDLKKEQMCAVGNLLLVSLKLEFNTSDKIAIRAGNVIVELPDSKEERLKEIEEFIAEDEEVIKDYT